MSKSSLPRYSQIAVLQGHTKAVSAVKFSPDGVLLASSSADFTTRLWTSAGKHVCTLTGHAAGISDHAWVSPRILATASDDCSVKVWNTSGDCSATLIGHNGVVFSLCSHQNLASGGQDGTVRIWDMYQGVSQNVYRNHKGMVSSVDFSKNGLLVSGGSDGMIFVMDKLGAKVLEYKLPPGSRIACAKFCPNEKYILISAMDSTLYLYSVGKQAIVRKYYGHTTHEYCIFTTFSTTQGSWVVSGSEDFKVYIWDLQTAKIVQVLDGHIDVTVCVDCHPIQNLIASGSLGGDKSVKLWGDFT